MIQELKNEIKSILDLNIYTAREARQLLKYDWRKISFKMSNPVKQEMESLFYSILNSLEVVEEGFFEEDENYPEMLDQLKKLLKMINEITE